MKSREATRRSREDRRPAPRSVQRKARPKRSLRPYLRIIRTLLKDSLWRFKGSTVLILAADQVAVLLQGTAVVLFLRYAHWLEQDATISRFGYTWQARSSLQLLWGFAAAVGVLFAVSAGLTYLSRTRALKLRRRYEVFCSERALELLSTVPRVAPAQGQKIADDRTITRTVRSDARYAGRVLVSILTGIVPIITLVAVVGGLLFLNLRLTLLLLGIMAPSALLLYRVNRMGAQASRDMEDTSVDASRQYRRALRWLRGASFPRPDADWLSTSITQNEIIQRNLDAYERRLRTVEDARFVSGVFGAVAFLAIIGTFGGQIIESGTGFGALAVYLVALRTGIQTFRGVNARVSGVNRFYPQVKRYLSFVEASRGLLEGAEPVARPDVFRFELRRRLLDGSLPSWEADGPSRIGLLAPVGPDRYSISVLVDSLFGGSETVTAKYVLGSSAYVTAEYEPLVGQPLRASIGLPDDWDHARLVEELKSSRFAANAIDRMPDPDVPCDDAQWRRVNEGVRFALALLSAARSDAEWVFLDERPLLLLKEEQRKVLLEKLGSRFVVICYHRRWTEPGAYGEQIAAVSDGVKLIGLGPVSWFVEQRQGAEAAIVDGPFGDTTRIGSVYDDEEDDETDDDADLV